MLAGQQIMSSQNFSLTEILSFKEQIFFKLEDPLTGHQTCSLLDIVSNFGRS